MSLRLEMLQVARLAPKLLGDSTSLVVDFLHRQQSEDGGFKDRTGRSDLYYTVFGLDGLIALQAEAPVEQTARYLETFGSAERLDFVHLCCLARCRAALTGARPAGKDATVRLGQDPVAEAILRGIESHRTPDGGYNAVPHGRSGTAYGCFLALGAYQDLAARLPDPARLLRCLASLRTPDGAWSNEVGVPLGSTNATAAAVNALRTLQVPIGSPVGDWLLSQCQADGGFRASSKAPMPDLLSTATALHALAGLQIPLDGIRQRCLDFIDTLWTNEGSFHGHWADDDLDSEYTFYGLLALGHLSL
jgi:prenyltransferase beta subunit